MEWSEATMQEERVGGLTLSVLREVHRSQQQVTPLAHSEDAEPRSSCLRGEPGRTGAALGCGRKDVPFLFSNTGYKSRGWPLN